LKLDSGLREAIPNMIKVRTAIKIRGIKKAFLYSLKKFNILLSISDEKKYAIATVIISK